MNIHEWAENKVSELVAQIKYYMSEGIDRATAVKMVRQETIIGKGEQVR